METTVVYREKSYKFYSSQKKTILYGGIIWTLMKRPEKKVREEIDLDAACSFEQLLEAAP